MYSQLTQHDQVRPFWWELNVYSNGECDTEFAAQAVDTNTPGDDLGAGYGVLYRAEGTEAEGRKTRHDETGFDARHGQYRTGSRGFWVVFLDGMRWYPGAPEGPRLLDFGAETRRIPLFITSQGDPLYNAMLRPELYAGPLFSFIPRDRRAWDENQGPYPFPDEPLITRVCIRDAHIRDNQDGLMVIPNGRLMIWVTGDRDDVPWRYFNMLRQRAGRINIPDAQESQPPAERAHGPQVPETIKQVVREIGGEV
ncbi:hypothetical protein F4820DRAFT_415703 [Hypoxylon rubiginosum]|uniref:Uncharacterized protein n=1 Tax=Hypoxylon rubiginosum TaxID=110542 RepID=A0ACB9Z692_9PEZI|nr:hypothetical protein F4820DRAFT_415703 [Hypoxylon rubiginosum]